MLRSYLKDEFRVRLAQEALLGAPPSGADAGLQVPVTPYEFWKFYRDERTESQIVLLPIRVDSPEFLNKVGQPSEDDLMKLFDAHKTDEPDPSKAEAGFKQPTRLQIQWVSPRPNAPIYRQGAEVAMAVAQATMPLEHEMTLRDYYDRVKFDFIAPSWLGPEFAIADANFNRVENVVALVGQPGGAGNRRPRAVGGVRFSGSGGSP